VAYSYVLTTAVGKVRLLIPDNDSTSYDLQDEEISYLLTERGNNVKAAAADACNWLARKYAKMVSFSADGLSVQHTQRAQAFRERAMELAAASQGGMSSVGIKRSDGYSENATDSEYESRTVYIDV
jgi:hypothetical protein